MATPTKKAAKKKAAKKKALKKKTPALPSEITMHYIKTNGYRTYHVDGAFGGLTSKGNIYCEFFVERNVTPQQVTYEIEENGQLGKEKERSGKKGFIRQIECGISLDIKTAVNLKEWLEKRINEYNEISSVFEEK